MSKYPWIAAVVLLFTACATVGPYTPVFDVKSDKLPAFPINGTVTIENVQTKGEPMDLRFRGIIVNLNESTQALVDALRQELRSRGAVVGANGTKHLSVSVTQISMITGANVYRANTDIVVTTRNDQTVTILATRASLASGYNLSWKPTKPLDASMSDAVMQILADPTIQQYLGE